MLIDPESYYDLFIKDKETQELIEIIKELEKQILKLKLRIKMPDYVPLKPSEKDMISNLKECLILAKDEFLRRFVREDDIHLDYTIDSKTKNKILERIFKKMKKLPLNTETSTFKLLEMVLGKSEYLNHKYVFKNIILDDTDLFSLDYEIKVLAILNGIVINDTIHANEILGFPFNIDFKIVNY